MTNALSKKFRASVDDASFEIEVAADHVHVKDATAASTFTLSSRGQQIDVRSAPESSADESGTPSTRAFVATTNDLTWVCIDGEVFTIELEDAQHARRPRAASGEGLSAPMPATVIRVIAEPGREVKRGETLLLLEAMKMELPVRAPRDGKVKALHCQAGQLVQPGVPLVELE
jgi:biotin carboxyl carrier protein